MATGVKLMIVNVVRIRVGRSLLEVATCLADGVWPETAPSTSEWLYHVILATVVLCIVIALYRENGWK